VSIARFLRVVSFQPDGPESPVDAELRDTVVPRLLDRPEILEAWIGRQGSGAERTRILATTWCEEPGAEPTDLAALDGLAGPGPGDRADRAQARLPDRTRPDGGWTVVAVEALPLAVHARFERSDPARILRVFRGHVRSGELEAYVEEARTGMLADAAINEGLIAFALGVAPPDDFVTVSAWTGWSAIESATGGNTRQPFVTRNSARLAAFTVAHYEVLPETPDHRPAAVGPGASGSRPDADGDTS
jgi:hypothetical protein